MTEFADNCEHGYGGGSNELVTQGIYSVHYGSEVWVTNQTSVKRGGSYAYRINATDTSAVSIYVRDDIAEAQVYYGRCWIRRAANPSSFMNFIQLGPDSDDGNAQLGINTSGQIVAGFADGVDEQLGAATGPTLVADTWTEVTWTADTSGSTWTIDWTVDGAAQTSASYAGGSAKTLANFAFGTFKISGAASCDFYLDDMIVSDAPISITGYKRFYGPAQLADSAATLYTCPASTIARTLHIHVSNPSGVAVDANLSIGTDAVGTRVWDDLAIPADGVKDVFDPYELAAGETIQGWAASAGTVVITITGYEDPV